MTDPVVAENTRRVRYVVTNPLGQAVFPITFPVVEIEGEYGIDVYINDVLKDPTDYTVDLDAMTITLDTNAAEDDVVVLDGATPAIRLLGYALRGGPPSARLNQEFNSIYYMLQELLRDRNRSLIIPRSLSDSFDSVLPVMGAGKAIIINDTADGFAEGPDADQIQAAQGYAVDAQAALADALIAQAAAEAAAIAAAVFDPALYLLKANAREKLTANRTYYVRADGSDSNDGLANTAGGAFLTIQKAIDTIYASIDLGGYFATIQVGAGTYASFNLDGIMPNTRGATGGIVITGDTTTPANCVISASSGSAISVANGARLTLGGFKITNSGGQGINVNQFGSLRITGKMDYGACSVSQIIVQTGAIFANLTDYNITGAAAYHLYCSSALAINSGARTVTITGTPAFSSAFVAGVENGTLNLASMTFSGSATGPRYLLSGCARFIGSDSLTYFPGNSVGSVAAGSAYGTLAKSKAPSVTRLTTGSGTYNTPDGATALRVRMAGGGGGSGGSGTSGATNGGNGGNTTFGSLTANGGTGSTAATTTSTTGGAGGTATGGDSNYTGQQGGTNWNASSTTDGQGPAGGNAVLFNGAGNTVKAATAAMAGIANTGGGASGTGGNGAVASTGGGGGGGSLEAIIASPAATYSYAVGAAGAAGNAGTSGFAGAAGGSGVIIIEVFF